MKTGYVRDPKTGNQVHVREVISKMQEEGQLHEIYHVITTGKHGYKLWKQGNKKATRVYKDGVEMRDAVGYYLISRECDVIIHHPDASVWRVIKSDRVHPQY